MYWRHLGQQQLLLYCWQRSERDLESSALDAWCWASRTNLKTHPGFDRRHLKFCQPDHQLLQYQSRRRGTIPSWLCRGCQIFLLSLHDLLRIPLVSWENSVGACFLPDHQSAPLLSLLLQHKKNCETWEFIFHTEVLFIQQRLPQPPGRGELMKADFEQAVSLCP